MLPEWIAAAVKQVAQGRHVTSPEYMRRGRPPGGRPLPKPAQVLLLGDDRHLDAGVGSIITNPRDVVTVVRVSPDPPNLVV